MNDTDYDRQVIAKARETKAIPGDLRALCARTGEDDPLAAAFVAFLQAQERVSELLNLIERLAGTDA